MRCAGSGTVADMAADLYLVRIRPGDRVGDSLLEHARAVEFAEREADDLFGRLPHAEPDGQPVAYDAFLAATDAAGERYDMFADCLDRFLRVRSNAKRFMWVSVANRDDGARLRALQGLFVGAGPVKVLALTDSLRTRTLTAVNAANDAAYFRRVVKPHSVELPSPRSPRANTARGHARARDLAKFLANPRDGDMLVAVVL